MNAATSFGGVSPSASILMIDPNQDSGTSPPKAGVPGSRSLPDAETTKDGTAAGRLLTVREAASLLHVSESWVRRHKHELPFTRLGRNIRFSESLLDRLIQGRLSSGNRSKPEREKPMTFQVQRYQRGYVYQTKGKVKTWYGMYREDLRTPNGQIERRQRHVRLGTLAELPTKNAAREKLAQLMQSSSSSRGMSFDRLVQRWQKAEGPTMKPTTLAHYQNALRAYVVPYFGQANISSINREDVQIFLAEKAKRYSESTLRSMRVVLSLTLGWAKNCGWLQSNPCAGIKLPQQTGGRKVIRKVLTAEQVNALAAKLDEPYATLVVFLAATGLRIGEAIGIKPSDLDGNVLDVVRRIYDGEVGPLKTKSSIRKLPLNPELVDRLRTLGNQEWIFCSRAGTPVNPGNAWRRHVQPAAQELGLELGGWHDFRHSLTTSLRRNGVHPKVISAILGHSKVNLAMDTYDHAELADFKEPLAAVGKRLLRNVTKTEMSA